MSGPDKKEGKKPAYIQKREDAARNERERQHHEENLTAINRIADELVTTEDKEQTSDTKKAFREKVTIFLILLTFVAAAVGDFIFYRTMVKSSADSAMQYEAMRAQQQVMQGQLNEMTQDRRPRISVVSAKLTGAVTIDKPFDVSISYVNIGREAARGLTRYAAVVFPDAKVMDAEESFDELTSALTATECRTIQASPVGLEIQPSTDNALVFQVWHKSQSIMRDVHSGRRVAVIFGCMGYEGTNRTEKVPFCYYLLGNGRGGGFLGRCTGRVDR